MKTLKELVTAFTAKGLKELSAALGRQLLKDLVADFGVKTLKELVTAFTAKGLKEAVEALTRATFKNLIDDLGVALTKELVDAFTAKTLKEVFDHLGRALFKDCAKELGAKTMKELWTTLGQATFKELAETLGAKTLKELTDAFTVAGVKELSETFTKDVLKELVTEFGAAGLKKAWDAVGKTMLKDLVTEFTVKGLKKAWDEIGEAGMKVLATDLTAAEIKALYDDLAGLALKHLTDGLTGKQIVDLLRNHGVDKAFFKSLGEVAGSGKALASALTHFGSAANLAQILNKAFTSTMPVATLKTFLEDCVSTGFKKIPEILKFFDEVVADGAGAWAKGILGGKNFVADSVGNLTQYGGRTFASTTPVATRQLTLSDGSKIILSIDPHDVLHAASRHTWEFFAMVMGNVKGKNSMFAAGTKRADVEAHLVSALNSAEADAAVRTLAPGGKGAFPFGAMEMFIDCSGPKGIVSIYPTPGIEMPKHLMKAAIWLWKSL